MNFTGNNIQFLSSYWTHLNGITNDIKNNLPLIDENVLTVKRLSKNFALISYRDLENWDISGLLNHKSNVLMALADKIVHMVYKGDAINIEPMLKRICFKGVKKLKQPNHGTLGYGHFRWNYRSYVLKGHEIEKIINYFNL